MVRVSVTTIIVTCVVILSVLAPNVISDRWRADVDTTNPTTAQDSGSLPTDLTDATITREEPTATESVLTKESTFTATTESDTTTPEKPTEKPLPIWVGFVGCLVASLFFGSNLLPVKQFSAGDGVFFQFAFCVAVWIIGLILDRIIDNNRFYPLVMLGGNDR